MEYLPHPSTYTELKEILETSKEKSPISFKYLERNYLESRVQMALYPNGISKNIVLGDISSDNNDYMNAYSITRSMVQCGEACNKLLSTIRLLHTSKAHLGDCICPSLKIEYCGGTIIPTLYYSNLAALTSLMSSFGCVSLRGRNTGRSCNVVRTADGWKVFDRRDYITKLSGTASKGWHIQFVELLDGLKPHLIDFPDIDFARIKSISQMRNKTHYEVLGSVSLTRVSGLENFFDVLLTSINTINHALASISSIYSMSGLAGFSRFREAYGNLGVLYKDYGKALPADLLPILF